MDYLIDTNIISELRKLRSSNCNQGVREWYGSSLKNNARMYMSWLSIGEIYAGVFNLRRRNDNAQAKHLDQWVQTLVADYEDKLLPIAEDVIKVWGRLLWPKDQHPIDKLIAATAIVHDLTLVTRNTNDFKYFNLRILNPFS